MFGTLTAVLLFGYSTGPNQIPLPQRAVGVEDKKECVAIAKEMAKRFNKQYPTESFIAECRDDQQRTYFKIKHIRFYPETKSEIV